MKRTKTGMNSRLSELFRDVPPPTQTNQTVKIQSLYEIYCPHPLIKEMMGEVLRLTPVIREYNHVLPLIVCQRNKTIHLVAGYKQYYAAKLMRLTECEVKYCALTPEQELQLAFEDLQNETLRASLVQTYQRDFAKTTQEIGKTLSVSPAYVVRLLQTSIENDRLLELRRITE